MPDYKKGKIYTVRCKTDDNLIYVGSTIETLSNRFAKHKSDSLRRPDICFYQFVDDWNNWYIELHEHFACDNKEQLNKREGEIIREIGTINKQIAGRTNKEWYQDHKEDVKSKSKEYYKNNKEKIQEYYERNQEKIKEYRKTHYLEKIECECGSVFRKGDLSQHKKTKKHKAYIETLTE